MSLAQADMESSRNYGVKANVTEMKIAQNNLERKAPRGTPRYAKPVPDVALTGFNLTGESLVFLIRETRWMVNIL